jgi:hypothetical protein
VIKEAELVLDGDPETIFDAAGREYLGDYGKPS